MNSEKLVKQEVTISCSEEEAGRKLLLPEKFQIDENKMFWLREEWRGERKTVVREDKEKIEVLLSTEEFLALIEVKHSSSEGLNHEVNFSTGNIVQQEVQKPCSEKEVNHILEAREKKNRITEVQKKVRMNFFCESFKRYDTWSNNMRALID